MKEKWSTFQESLSEVTSMSRREFLLITAVCILGGMVFGLLFSPRKYVMIGSQNGNSNGDNSGNVNGKNGELYMKEPELPEDEE